MRTAAARDLMTGLVSLAGLFGLGLTLWLIGDAKEWFQHYYSFDIRLPAAPGVTSSSSVTLNGVRIGKIVDTRLDPERRSGVLMTLKVRRGNLIPKDFTIYIDRSFVGQTTVQLEVPPTPAQDGGNQYVQEGDIFEKTSTSLYDLVLGPLKEPLEKFSKAADSFSQVATTYNDVGLEFKDALADRTPAQVDAGAAPPNVRSVIARLDSAAANINKWLGDDTFRDQTTGLAGKLSSTADAWTKTAQTLDEKSSLIADQASITLHRMSDASEQVTQFTAGINRGEGTLGLLVKNPDLYNSVKDAADRLERALREMQLLVQKYKDEGIPLKF